KTTIQWRVVWAYWAANVLHSLLNTQEARQQAQRDLATEGQIGSIAHRPLWLSPSVMADDGGEQGQRGLHGVPPDRSSPPPPSPLDHDVAANRRRRPISEAGGMEKKLKGCYQPQDYSAYDNTTSSTSPLGFAEWRMYNNPLMSFAQTAPFGTSSIINNCNINVNGNGFYQNPSPYPTSIWANYATRNHPYCTNYGPATNDHVLQAPSFHNNNSDHNKDLGCYQTQQTTPFSRSIIINNCNINVNSNGFHQNSSPYPTSIWSNYVPRNQPYCTNYGPTTNDHVLQAHFHNNNNQQEKDIGFATSFGAATPVVSASPFELMTQRPTNCSSAQIFQDVKNLDLTSRAFGSGEIEGSDTSKESDPAPELETQNQLGLGNEDIKAMDAILNCKDYRTVLRKDLTNSDCGNIGRIVLPKRDAEANLPALVDKDGMILEMEDFELPDVWKFKYRYWPNNKSRMYILETTGEFVKRHSLEAGDILILYKHKRTDRHVARAVKAIELSSTMNVLECQCMKAGNSAEECGFAVCLTKKT
ncbi:hypothetical protein EJB05_16055, partial [Eragrostis curvula]